MYTEPALSSSVTQEKPFSYVSPCNPTVAARLLIPQGNVSDLPVMSEIRVLHPLLEVVRGIYKW